MSRCWVSRTFSVVVLATALAAGDGLAAGDVAIPAAAPPGYISETLPNGLRVSIVPVPENPVVSTQVWYHVGSANEEPQTRGFAHLFEHLMFGGTPAHTKKEVWEQHERFGGSTNAYTSLDDTVYVSEIAPAGHDAVLEIEADRMVNLALSQENLDNEKKIVTEELRLGTENSPQDRLMVATLKAILGEHPYALTPVGTKDDIAAATLEHAREFYAQYYRPRNAHLVIAGPVDGPRTLEKVRAAFGPLPADGTTPSDVPAIYGWKFPAEVDLAEDLPPVETASLVFQLPPADSPDAFTLEVMDSLLTANAVDPFEEELVNTRHKALGAGIETMDARRGGALVFYSYNLPYRRRATAFRLMEEARQTLARFDWVNEELLAATKRKLQRDELQQAYFASYRASRIGYAQWYGGDERRAFESAARIEEVTLDAVKTAFRKYVLDPVPTRVYVSPEHVPLMVRLFGWFYPLVHR